jgi:hypothetical protein
MHGHSIIALGGGGAIEWLHVGEGQDVIGLIIFCLGDCAFACACVCMSLVRYYIIVSLFALTSQK